MESVADIGVFEGRGLGCVRGARPVFAALDFRIGAGGALVLSGPNGSGKSSLLRVMAGLLPPAAGTLAWDGTPVGAAPELHRARLHYLGHHDAVKPLLSVAENLRFWAGLRAGGDAGIADALARVGLEHLADAPARLLSAGQRRRLSLARILATPAPLWLLDEPSVGLDAASLRTLAEVVDAHRAAGGRIVVATHQSLDLPAAAHLALDDYPPATPDPEEVW